MPHLEYFSDSPEPAAPRLQDWLVNDKFLGISEHLAVASFWLHAMTLLVTPEHRQQRGSSNHR